MNFEQAITQLQDTLIVVAEIQRRQADVQRTQAEGLALSEKRLSSVEESMALHDKRMAHIDMRLAEITDKLDGLIGFRWRARPARPGEDGQHPKN